MFVVVVVACLFVSGGDAISGLRLPDWTELRNRGDSSLSRSSRSYSFTMCSSLEFVFGLFVKLRSKLASVETRQDLTRMFHCIYMRPDAGLSLILSLSLKGIYVVVKNHQDLYSNQRKVLPLNQRRNCLESGGYSLDHSMSTDSTSRRHSLPRLRDR